MQSDACAFMLAFCLSSFELICPYRVKLLKCCMKERLLVQCEGEGAYSSLGFQNSSIAL